MKKCKPNTVIELGECVADLSLSDNVIGKTQ